MYLPWGTADSTPLPHTGPHRLGLSGTCLSPGLRNLRGPRIPGLSPAFPLPTGCLNCSKVSELTERLKALEAKVGEQPPSFPDTPSPSCNTPPSLNFHPQGNSWVGQTTFPQHGVRPGPCPLLLGVFPIKLMPSPTAWHTIPPGGHKAPSHKT